MMQTGTIVASTEDVKLVKAQMTTVTSMQASVHVIKPQWEASLKILLEFTAGEFAFVTRVLEKPKAKLSDISQKFVTDSHKWLCAWPQNTGPTPEQTWSLFTQLRVMKTDETTFFSSERSLTIGSHKFRVHPCERQQYYNKILMATENVTGVRMAAVLLPQQQSMLVVVGIDHTKLINGILQYIETILRASL